MERNIDTYASKLADEKIGMGPTNFAAYAWKNWGDFGELQMDVIC